MSFFIASLYYHFLPLQKIGMQPMNALKYWITVKACSTYLGATHYLGPGGWAVRVTSFPLMFPNLNGATYFEDYIG